MLFRGLFGDGRSRLGGVAAAGHLALPNKVLDEVAFVSKRVLAFSITSRTSPTSSRPSWDSLLEGRDRGLEARVLFIAMSICLFCSDHVREAPTGEVGWGGRSSHGWYFAILESYHEIDQ